MKRLIALFITFSMLIVSCTSADINIGNLKKVNTDKFTVEQKKKLDDVNYLIDHIKNKWKGDFYKNISEEDFEKAKNELIAKVPTLTDMTFYFEFNHLVSLFHDNTMWMYPKSDLQMQMYYSPFFVYYVDGAYYVFLSYDEKYLGYKVDAINGMPMDKVVDKLKYVEIYENKQSQYNNINDYLKPELLKYLNIIDDIKKIKFTMEKDGKKEDVTLKSLKITNGRVSENFHMLQSNKIVPTSLVEKFYSSKILDGNVYYIQYNKCAEDDTNKISQFVNKIKSDYKEKKFKKVIVDFRRNAETDSASLGKSDVFVPVIQEMQELSKQGVKVYELVGLTTMGVCITNCLQLKKYTNCTIVGSPTGTSVNPFISNEAILMLPKCGLKFHFSGKYIENDKDSKDDAINPDVKIDYTFKQTIEGNDLETQYVLNN